MNDIVKSIDELGLSKRTENALHRAGIHTMEAFMVLTNENLKNIRNLGQKSIEEIQNIIAEIQNIGYEHYFAKNSNISEPAAHAVSSESTVENFDEWLKDKAHQEFVANYLKEEGCKIDALDFLSTRAYNALLLSDIYELYDLAFKTTEQLLPIKYMDDVLASEIEKACMRFIRMHKDQILGSYFSQSDSQKTCDTIYDWMQKKESWDAIRQYMKWNNIEIEKWDLSKRARNALLKKGYFLLSDIIFLSKSQLKEIPAMGSQSVEEIITKRNQYLEANEKRLIAVLQGDLEALWDDDMIKEVILSLYQENGFIGLSLADIIERTNFPSEITQERIKKNIGQLLAAKKLEYVDYRCYRVYDKFEKWLHECDDIDDREKSFIQRRLNGKTLEEIALEDGITRERVRQIVDKAYKKVCNSHEAKTKSSYFDEDYYFYVFHTYEFDDKDAKQWLGIDTSTWKYLEMREKKRGKKALKLALEDYQNINLGLRLKIKNYLNRNKVYIDNKWVEKKRADLEEVAVKKLCIEDKSFLEFATLYNEFLESEEVDYDENIYYTEAVYRTRKNRLSEAKFLLWKQNELMRYYDIDGRDYTELLDTLNIDQYENIEISTEKLVKEFPELMEKYDIRDQYELHNLLRKIVPDGSYNDFHCGRMPNIKFGEFNRDSAILDMIIAYAPISQQELAEKIHEEYGYDIAVIIGTYLQPFSDYYHQGQYTIDAPIMDSDERKLLETLLSEDFYYLDEIKKIYMNHIPHADIKKINAYNLKGMGFLVYSRYAVKNHHSLDAYFESILTQDDFIDLKALRKRYTNIQSFSQKLMQLKRELKVIEFEHNTLINFKKLDAAGITKEQIQDFCNQVYDFVEDNQYFSATSIHIDGFESELYELGFSDWFYGNLLLSDERFSSGNMFDNLIFYKGKKSITIASFEENCICADGSIDAFDLLNELTEHYGCKISEKSDMIYKIHGTSVFYDRMLDRLYANEEIYYRELENMGEF